MLVELVEVGDVDAESRYRGQRSGSDPALEQQDGNETCRTGNVLNGISNAQCQFTASSRQCLSLLLQRQAVRKRLRH